MADLRERVCRLQLKLIFVLLVADAVRAFEPADRQVFTLSSPNTYVF